MACQDRKPLSRPPTSSGFLRMQYYFDRFFYRPLFRGMDFRDAGSAKNTNSLGEVPNSTWFTNRIGVRDMTPEEIGRGPGDGKLDAGAARPWIITGTKVGGVSPGFVFKTADGAKYILKFDAKGEPEMETGADVVAQRILWASGFNVPDDNVVFFRSEDLVLAKDAVVSDTFGKKRAMTHADLLATLDRVEVERDGSYRGLASKYLPGIPLGGIAAEGVRKDDSNDTVAHELRRDLRGQYVFFSWIDHTDVKQDNTLDMYDPAQRHVVHYLVDFGKALGALGWIEKREEDGFAYSFDFGALVTSTLTLGLATRPWEGADGAKANGDRLRGLGRFDSKHFEATNWSPAYPWEPFKQTDRFDAYWAAKIIARFTPVHIRAAAEAAQYSSPDTTEAVIQILRERQHKILAHWFSQVAALDMFAVEGNALCFSDLEELYLPSAKSGRANRVSAASYTASGGNAQSLEVPPRGS
ncbi:MAG: hypothetical protein JKY56_02045, partial [Kofleriaceae bacterium]|nr:hypothetical protein [Kofleriaceae bacterium]